MTTHAERLDEITVLLTEAGCSLQVRADARSIVSKAAVQAVSLALEHAPPGGSAAVTDAVIAANRQILDAVTMAEAIAELESRT